MDSVPQKLGKIGKILGISTVVTFIYFLAIVLLYFFTPITKLDIFPKNTLYLLLLFPPLIACVVTFLKLKDHFIGRLLYAILAALIMGIITVFIFFVIVAFFLIGIN